MPLVSGLPPGKARLRRQLLTYDRGKTPYPPLTDSVGGRLGRAVAPYYRETAGRGLAEDVRCLTLLGSAGDRAEWQSRRLAEGNAVFPLADIEMVECRPLILRLITALGLDVAEVVAPTPRARQTLALSRYGVFHVQEAAGSAHLSEQDDLVLQFGIESVVGFGGLLYTGDFYAVLMFSKVEITEQVASNLKILSLPVRVPLLPFAGRNVFAKRLEE